MASDTPHKQEFRIRDLTTRSVLLFPTRACVIRDIKEITLQPGANQIVIDGIAPTADEQSIKVEGTGSATISDVTVDLLPNREVFEDIYPSDSEDESDDEENESEGEVEAMTAVNSKLKKANDKLLDEQEKLNSASNRLQICDNFGKSVEKTRPDSDDLENVLKAYHDEREKIYLDHQLSTAAIEKIREDIQKTQKEKVKIAKELVKAGEKKRREQIKLRDKKLRKQREFQKEKQRIRAERESFWPKKVYKITVNLEPSTLTPSSSRRNSIDGDTVVNLATSDFHEPSKEPLKNDQISLSLSYITYAAYWSPRYDLSLNSVKCAGILEYGAEITNTTSETWKDAKVILSTSQTSFSGLSENIPTLYPWHVRLQKGFRQTGSALFSQKELDSKRYEWEKTNSANQRGQKNREDLFGNQAVLAKPASKASRANQVQQVILRHSQAAPSGSNAFGAQSNAVPNGRGGAFGGGGVGSSFAPRLGRSVPAYDNSEETLSALEDMGFDLFGGEPAPSSLVFEEGAWETEGLTTTYDVPGVKTLAPSNSTIKHKIAKIEFKNIVFSRIVIGKLRQVAFLKARIRNGSKISLLKGPLGLTLDGSFLGRASFPRCSVGETFSLPLGTDPSINVHYPKPTVRRSQSGIFSKEDSNVFTRTVILTNTKHNSSVELTVLDQIPLSEEERLKIDITNPRGLKAGSDGVRTGQSISAGAVGSGIGNASNVRASVYGGDGKDASKDGKWGSAVAFAKKDGEVSWNVKLNPGQGVKLVLEYEATFPGGESIVGVDDTNN